MIGLIGKKIGMTTIFGETGEAIPVTIVKAGPCEITQLKSPEKDGYSAVQMGFDITQKRITKPLLGHFKKAGTKIYKKLKEFRVRDVSQYEIGQSITVEEFQKGEKVSIKGVSKGKGFQGGRRRWKFSGGPKSHGQSNKWRAPGSIGQSSDPSRVLKGTKMGGRMGGKVSSLKAAEIVQINPEDNLILIKGAVVGPRNGYVILEKK